MARPIDMLFDGVKWSEAPQPTHDDGVPYVTHEGVLQLPEMLPMRCYRLSSGQTVFDGLDFEAWLHDLDADPPEAIKTMLAEGRVEFRR